MPGVRAGDSRVAGRGKLGQTPPRPDSRTEPRPERPAEGRRGESTASRQEGGGAGRTEPRERARGDLRMGFSAAAPAAPVAGGSTLAGRNGRQGGFPGVAPGTGPSQSAAEATGLGAAAPARSPVAYPPRQRSLPPEAPESAELAQEDEDAAELSGTGITVAQIPPREHSERERLAMRPEIRGELGQLIDDLRSVFEADRSVAMQSANTRCGVCYLHHRPEELEYREVEGFYVCERCSQALRGKRLPMIRRQQH